MVNKVVGGKLVLTHSQFKRQITEYLQYNKWLVIPIAQGPFSHKGIFDLYILRRGFSAWVELKVGKDKLSDYQVKFQRDIFLDGGKAWVIRSLEELEAILKDFQLGGKGN